MKTKMSEHPLATYINVVELPIGRLRIVATDEGLRAVLWDSDREKERVLLPEKLVAKPGHPVLTAAVSQLREYFKGTRIRFELPLAPRGTPFQLRAWQLLAGIGYGETISYQEQAEKLGGSQYARAVGAANGKNPISIIVPCHRVIGKNGNLTGFAGGIGTKATLLEFENYHCRIA